MRIYVSIDAEGLPGIFHPEHLAPKRALFDEMRRVMSAVVQTVVNTLLGLGVESIWVADSHGFMGNIPIDKVPKNVVLVRGCLRPIAMVYGIDKGFDGAMFLGYHSAAGTQYSVLEHTMSGRAFFEIRVNGRRASEFYLNALVAGHFGVPVVLVMGDDKLRHDVETIAPWVIYVETKSSISRYAIVSKSLDRVLEELREAIPKAIDRIRNGEAKPLHIETPIALEVVFRYSEYADAAENIPGVERIDAYTVKYIASDPVKALKMIELMALLAYAVDNLRTL